MPFKDERLEFKTKTNHLQNIKMKIKEIGTFYFITQELSSLISII